MLLHQSDVDAMSEQKIPQALPVVFYVFSLFPGEADHTHNVDNDNGYGNDIAEERLHPVFDL